MFRGFALDKAKTFRPRRNHRVGTKRYELHKYAQARRVRVGLQPLLASMTAHV